MDDVSAVENQPNNGLSKDKLSGVDKLEAMMKWQQEIINSQENISRYFDGDSEMLKIAEECWKQIHGKIGEVVKTEYHRILEDFKMMDKLHSCKVEREDQSSGPAWRPSGNPRIDFAQAANSAVRMNAIPQFKKMYEDVQNITGELQEQIKQRQQELLELETQINDKFKQLDSNIPD